MDTGEIVSITPQECSIEGGECLVLTFCNPVAVPDEDSTFIYFSGSQENHRISTTRGSPNSLVASIPSHSTAEMVELSVCCVDEKGLERSLHKSKFTYFFDKKAFVADMLQSAADSENSQLKDCLFPPLSSADAVRDYDMCLVEALNEMDLPEGWSVVGTVRKDGHRISTVKDCSPKETLLHFAARHGFNSFAQHLLSLPGSSIAAVLPNKEGKIPIQIAQDCENEGLVQLLALYMRQVGPDGKMIQSPSPSPKQSPNHVLVQRVSQGEQEQAERNTRVQDLNRINLKRINQEWRSQVNRRKHSIGSSTTEKNLSVLPRHNKRRRSLCALVSLPVKREGDMTTGDSTEGFECVNRAQDPEIMEIDRLRKISWSVVVGAVDSRSIDTGLNELQRITAEEVLQKRLVNIRSELSGMEHNCGKPSNQLQGHTQSQIILRSLSCPMLDQSDEEQDEAVSPIGSSSPKSSPRKAIASVSSLPTVTNSSVQYHSVNSYEGSSVQTIPTVITTKYSIDSSDLDFQSYPGDTLHSDINTGSLSASIDDLENSSGDQLDQEKGHSVSLLAPETHEEDVSPACSASAPDLFQILSDTEDQSPVISRQSSSKQPLVPVEESIVEHRSLRQTAGTYSPVSDELRDTGTDQTNTSLESDFVIIQSPNQNPSVPQPDEQETDSDKELKELTQSMDVARRPPKLGHQGHRRSLSTSDVENMRGIENGKASKIWEEEGMMGAKRPSTVAVITPLSNGGGTPGQDSVRKLDADEHSHGGSVQTLDTNSHHGSDESSEEEVGETDDQLSALESQVSLEPVPREATITHTQVNYNGMSNLSPVILRGKKRSSNPLNRYSAEYLITNIDDDLAAESDDGEITPTISLLNRFSHRRINSTSAPLTTVGQSDQSIEVTEELDGHNLENLDVPKKLSMCSGDSVFLNNPEEEVITLADVDVKVDTNDSTTQSLENSLDVSLEQSSGADEKYYTHTGLPKTIRKKNKRSSKSSRKGYHSPNENQSPLAERKGLKKEDVSPTIKHLRKLIDLEELEDSYSDDSDTAVASVRTSSALERTTGSNNLQRSKSSVSDSVTLQQQHRATVSFANTIARADSPGSLDSACTLQQELECDPNQGTSLDFAAGSPITRQVYNQLVQPASPLSFSVTKSPPTSSQGLSTEALSSTKTRQTSNSSPGSPMLGRTTPNSTQLGRTTPNSTRGDRELQDRHEVAKRKFEHAKSLYDSSTEPVKFFMDSKEVFEECKLPDREHGSSVRKFIRGGFFRGSKQTSKKITKVSSTGKSESDQDSPVPSATVAKRAKSAKASSSVSKPSNSTIDAQLDPQSNSITRSTSMQVGLQDPGQPKPAQKMTRHKSDDVLTSPTKIRNAQSLSTLEEANGRSVAFPFPPHHQGSGGESDNEEGSMVQIALTANHPELQLKDELVWERTVDRKVFKKINKSERERQAILHELLHTEKQHFRALHVLKLIFRQGISKQVPEETVNHLFPKLEELIDISKDFITRMEKKKVGNIINDLSDVLLEQFSGPKYDQMLRAFSGFCSGHLNAMEIYKDLYKQKRFSRLMNELNSVKECQRLTLPDYYTKVTQRLSQLITLMNRLGKKTESLKLDHCPVLLSSMSGLQQLVAAVDQAVEDRKNRMELMDMQSRLEINVPKSSKITNRQDLKNLSLTAHGRELKRRGEATWMGHGKQLSVQVVLVTDFVILLTERDQKFHLASLQDLKPPVIRLYDLMVRTNVSVKSGVQLLLVEQSSNPEMYKLDFAGKKEAKQWLNSLNVAIEECREKGLKCEYFGAEQVTSGDEDRKLEEKEVEESVEEVKAARAVPNILPSKSDPEVQRHQRARERLHEAEKLLLAAASVTTDQSASSRHQDSAAKVLQLRQRSHTVRPKTAYFPEETDAGGSSQTIPGDHVISYPQPPTKFKPVKEKEKKKIIRSSTFRNKDKKEEKEKPVVAGVVTFQGNEEGTRSEQTYVQCISKLKSSLEEILKESSEKTKTITKLQEEVKTLKRQKNKKKESPKKPAEAPHQPQSPSPPAIPFASVFRRNTSPELECLDGVPYHPHLASNKEDALEDTGEHAPKSGFQS